MATFGPPIVNTGNLADGAVTSAKIALDTIAAVDVAPNAIGDSEVAAHTTTKITTPFSLVTGTVPLDQGGTGQTTATPAFDALAPTTTQGDIIYHNGTDNVRLGPGTAGHFLKTQGAGANPIWASSGLTFAAVNNVQQALGAAGVALSYSIPANALGTSGGIVGRLYISNESGSNSTMDLILGGTVIVSNLQIDQTTIAGVVDFYIGNRNDAAVQVAMMSVHYSGSGTNHVLLGTGTKDTTGALTLEIDVDVATTTIEFAYCYLFTAP